MNYMFANRVNVLTSTIGTGTLTLGNAMADMQAFRGNVTSGSTVNYKIEDGPLAWEIGSGTYTAGAGATPDTLTRDVVEESSSGTALISLSGHADVCITPSAGWLNNLQSQVNTITGGPFLPLSGGTVSGPVTIGHDQSSYWTFNGGTGFVQGTANGTVQFKSSNYYALCDANGNTLFSVTPTGSGTNTNNLQLFTAPSGTATLLRSNGALTLQPGAGEIGGLSVSVSPTYSGSQWHEMFSVNGNLAGATTATTITNVGHFNIFSDTVDASGSTLNLINYFQLDAQFGGAAKGFRQGICASIALNTALTSPGANYVGMVGSATATASAGGTGLTLATSAGGIFGANFYASTGGTAQNMGGVVGIEVNPAIGTGSTAVVLTGIQVVPTSAHTVRGAAHWDVGYLLASQPGAQGIDLGYVVGGSYGGAAWPIRADGSLFRGALGYSGGASATNGVMLNEVSFPAFGAARGGAFVSNGFAVDGVGQIQCGPAYLTPASGGLVLDVKGSVGIGTPTVAAGGSGYRVNDVLYDSYGGVYIVSAVSGTAVTAVTVRTGSYGETHQPLYPSHTTPTNPVPTTTWIWATGASGCTLNLTWNTTGTTLALQQGGGPTQIGGTLNVMGLATVGANTGSSSQLVLGPAAGSFLITTAASVNMIFDCTSMIIGWGSNPAIRFNSTNCFTANGTKAVSLTALAPAAASATVVEWLTFQDAAGNTRYVPCF